MRNLAFVGSDVDVRGWEPLEQLDLATPETEISAELHRTFRPTVSMSLTAMLFVLSGVYIQPERRKQAIAATSRATHRWSELVDYAFSPKWVGTSAYHLPDSAHLFAEIAETADGRGWARIGCHLMLTRLTRAPTFVARLAGHFPSVYGLGQVGT